MKKFLLSSLAMMLTVALSACGGSKEAATPAAPEAPAAPAKADEGSAPAKAEPAKPAEGSAPVKAAEPDTSVEEAMENAADAVGDAAEEAADAVGDAVEEAADAVEDAAEEMKEEVSGGSNLDKLIGTTWAFEDGTTLKFKDKETVNISGGQVSFLGENGIDASYEYNEEDGSFEMSAMGQSRSGTYDGEGLTIDGNAAEMQ